MPKCIGLQFLCVGQAIAAFFSFPPYVNKINQSINSSHIDIIKLCQGKRYELVSE